MIEIVPHCAYCRVKTINTRFPDGVMRHICPKCKKKLYTKMEDGWVEAKGYGIEQQ